MRYVSLAPKRPSCCSWIVDQSQIFEQIFEEQALELIFWKEMPWYLNQVHDERKPRENQEGNERKMRDAGEVGRDLRVFVDLRLAVYSNFSASLL